MDRKYRIGHIEDSFAPGLQPLCMRLHALELIRGFLFLIATFVLSAVVIAGQHLCSDPGDAFYASVTSPKTICSGINGTSISHSGYVGLNGDSEGKPKRSFYW